jgi:hypothetical protein
MSDRLNDTRQDNAPDARQAVILALAASRPGGATMYDILEVLPQWDRETLRADTDALVLAGKLVRTGEGRASRYVVTDAQ